VVGADVDESGNLWQLNSTAAAVRRPNRLLAELLHNPPALIGISILALLALTAIFAPLIARHNPDAWQFGYHLNEYPSGAHWFGTDYEGRDLFARVLFGGRISLTAALAVVVIGAGGGVPLGLVAGYVGGLLDDIFMRVMDILLSFPGIVFALLVVGILSSGIGSAVIAIGIGSIPFFARFARGSTLSIKENDYITAARVLGTPDRRIIRRHILTNAMGPLIVLCATTYAYAILATAALSFLGVGSLPPTSDWGVLLNQGNNWIFACWTEILFPGVAILLTTLAANLLGDGLGRVLNRRA
jgi:ABC-type dipeptide/oligopeptide/nickel transport system permease subunit